jgi:hypothetical protein
MHLIRVRRSSLRILSVALYIWSTEGIFEAILIYAQSTYIPSAFLRSGSDTDYGRSDKQLPPPPNSSSSSNSSSVPSCPYDRQLEQPAAAPGSPPGLGLVACVGRQFESPYATTDILAAQSQYRRHKVGLTKYSSGYCTFYIKFIP